MKRKTSSRRSSQEDINHLLYFDGPIIVPKLKSGSRLYGIRQSGSGSLYELGGSSADPALIWTLIELPVIEIVAPSKRGAPARSVLLSGASRAFNPNVNDRRELDAIGLEYGGRGRNDGKLRLTTSKTKAKQQLRLIVRIVAQYIDDDSESCLREALEDVKRHRALRRKVMAVKRRLEDYAKAL